MELGVKKDIPWSKMNIEEKYLGKKTFRILFLVEMLPKFNSKFFLLRKRTNFWEKACKMLAEYIQD